MAYRPLLMSLVNPGGPLYLVNRSGNVSSQVSSIHWECGIKLQFLSCQRSQMQVSVDGMEDTLVALI